jgi:phosphoribosylanthranilate isomerase
VNRLVKVCGLTNPEDASFAADLGADLLGFVVHPPSPRHCADLVHASRAVKDRAVLVSVGIGAEAMMQVANQAGLRWIQPHMPSDVHPEIRIDVVRRIRDQGFWVLQPWSDEPDQVQGPATLYLWESSPKRTGVPGGSGQPHAMAYPPPGAFLLAGGLHGGNLKERASAVPESSRAHLAGFDAASQLEASPGRKDPAKVRAFLEAARAL